MTSSSRITRLRLKIIRIRILPNIKSTSIPGVQVATLDSHRDERGVFTEIFRSEWGTEKDPVQWNVVRSELGVLRGVHVHFKHADNLLLVDGQSLFVLCDLRPGSPSERKVEYYECTGEALQSLYIPPGVAHGFYFYKPSLHVYSVSEYWDMADELGCRFDDPDLGIEWPNSDPMISERDRDLPSLESIQGLIPKYEPKS